jgi:putative tricarboxylic transport membrane protein
MKPIREPLINYVSQKDRIGATLIFIFSAVYLGLSQDIALQSVVADSAFTPRTLPQLLAVLSLILCVMIILKPTPVGRLFTRHRHWGKLALFVGLMSGYGLLLRPAGFMLASILFLTSGAWLLGERRHGRLILIACTITATFWVLMNFGLGVYIPPWPTGFNT